MVGDWVWLMLLTLTVLLLEEFALNVSLHMYSSILLSICPLYNYLGTNYRGQPFSGNTGASTFRTSSNRLLLFAESVIVTAHEIGHYTTAIEYYDNIVTIVGHSWGSQHDDTSMPECNPSQDEGGKFLMYPIAQDGSAPNNNVREKEREREDKTIDFIF